MKKKILIITLLLVGYSGTAQAFGVMGAIMIARKAGQEKVKVMVPTQTTHHTVSKGKKLVSENSRIASVKHVEGKTYAVTAKNAGEAFIAEVKEQADDFIKEFDKVIKKAMDKKKKATKKGFIVKVASKKMPTTIHEKEIKHVVRRDNEKLKQDNTKEDDADNIKISHKTVKSSDGTKHHLIAIKGVDSDKTPAEILNTTTGEKHPIKVLKEENK